MAQAPPYTYTTQPRPPGPLQAHPSPYPNIPSGSTWSVPAISLQQLLQSSSSLDLQGEVTPIQCWQRIRAHANWNLLEREGLEAMRDVLVDVVTCYDFGAVIDEDFFERLVEERMGGLGDSDRMQE